MPIPLDVAIQELITNDICPPGKEVGKDCNEGETDECWACWRKYCEGK